MLKNMNFIKYPYGYVILNHTMHSMVKQDIVDRSWIEATIPNDLHIVYSPENKFITKSKGRYWVGLLCNYCIDVISETMDLEAIASNMLERLMSSNSAFYDYIDGLNGRFICLYSLGENIQLLNDAMSLKSVYYYCGGTVLIASHYNLVHDFMNTRADEFYEVSKNQLVSSDIVGMPGSLTPWSRIKVLTPNHSLSIITKSVERFYPRRPMASIGSSVIVNNTEEHLKRISTLLVKGNYNIFQAITAGIGSRVAYAATYAEREKIGYFTYHDAVLKKNNARSVGMENDYNYASALCVNEGLNYKDIEIVSDANEAIYATIRVNHFKMSQVSSLVMKEQEIVDGESIAIRADLYNIVGDIGVKTNVITDISQACENFAKIAGYQKNNKQYNSAVSIFRDFYHENSYDRILDYPILVLFYWEYICSHRIPAITAAEDLVWDTVEIFNCRKILDTALHMPVIYRTRGYLFERIIADLLTDDASARYVFNGKNLLNYVDANAPGNGQIVFDKGCSYESGNRFDKNKKVSAIFESKQNSLTLGFGESIIKKGDFCKVSFLSSVKQGNDYCLQFTVKTSWVQGATGGIVYEIYVNEEEKYKLPITSFYFANQISYCFKAAKSGEINITFRLRATQDIASNVYNGWVTILDATIKTKPFNPIDSEENFTVIDTYSLLKANQLKSR